LDGRYAPPCTAFFPLRYGVGKQFCPEWSGTTVLLISALSVAGIIDVSYWCLAKVIFNVKV
jgi:hypothetical protein